MRTRASQVNPHIPFVGQTQEVAVEDRPQVSARTGRPTRGAIHGKRNKITVTGCEPGYHYCWVNEDNIGVFEEDGYEFVTHEVRIGDKQINSGSQIGSKVTKNMGSGVTGYLMRCTEEIHKELHDIINREVDESEATMRQGSAELVGEVKIGRGKENL